MEWLHADASASEVAAGSLDTERIGALCVACGQYGKSWLCPPVAAGLRRMLEGYTRMHITGLKIVPDPAGDDDGTEAMRRGRALLEPALLELEKKLQGRACGLSGKCPYCGEQPCARTDNKPCRHPELARPSLEAMGYDVTAIAAKFLKTPIKWARDGKPAEYYLLVGAVFY